METSRGNLWCSNLQLTDIIFTALCMQFKRLGMPKSYNSVILWDGLQSSWRTSFEKLIQNWKICITTIRHIQPRWVTKRSHCDNTLSKLLITDPAQPNEEVEEEGSMNTSLHGTVQRSRSLETNSWNIQSAGEVNSEFTARTENCMAVKSAVNKLRVLLLPGTEWAVHSQIESETSTQTNPTQAIPWSLCE